jgi:hypothetical protein
MTQLLIPVKVTVMNCFAHRPDPETMIPIAPKAWRITTYVWLATLMFVSSGIFFWGVIFLVALSCLIFGRFLKKSCIC